MGEHQALDFGFGLGGFVQALGMEFLGSKDGVATSRVAVTDLHLSPIGRVHGGVISSLIDTTMGFAILPLLEPGQFCVTLELKVTYVGNTSSGTMNCEARVIKRSQKVAMVEAQVDTDTGNLIAIGSATFYITGARAGAGAGPA